MKDFTFGDPASPPVLLLGYLGGVRPVLLEDSRGRKFTKFVTDHVFGNKYGYMHLAVVNCNRLANKIRADSTSASPCFDDGSIFGRQSIYLFGKLRVYEWSFF